MVPHPQPLATCPGRALWERYRGRDWLVFVDESFFMFFEQELRARTGYFCHGAVGIPTDEYGSLCAALKSVHADFVGLAGEALPEIKHSVFKRIPYPARRGLALRIRDTLVAHGAFIAGFYAPVTAFVLERVRVNLLGEAEELPEDYQALYDAAVRELKAEHQGPGQSGVIGALLELAVVGIANLLASLECGFTVIYDPREKKEDAKVRATVADFIALTGNMGVSADLRDDLQKYLRGIRSDRLSEEEPGLQMADLAAGEVSAFFSTHGEFLTHEASRKLVTPTSVEKVNTCIEVDGIYMKTGVLHRMPPALVARFEPPDRSERTVLPYFRKLLASGMLTCYSSLGQPRDLMPFKGLIWDQCE